MDEDLGEASFTEEDRDRYLGKVTRSMGALRRMLADERFETGRRLVGLEHEFYVVDGGGLPLMVNQQLLDALESDDFQTELGQFNIEFNLAPQKLTGRILRDLEEDLTTSVEHAHRRAADFGGQVAMIGILPTLDDLHVTEENISRNPRYHLLNEQILKMRGEDLVISIAGEEQLLARASSIMYEAAATSVQLHLEVDPDDLAAVWNASQAAAAVQVAAGCNSPFFLGKRLWRETRVALFEQSIDTRSPELAARGERPRVWFGERWVEGTLDLFEENLRYFPPLLPLLDGEDPDEALARGDVPHLKELALHNGTIYRWNRPVYGVARGKPHLRVENRVLPAGPTVVDAVANAALYFGLVRALVDRDPPITAHLTFGEAASNFFAAARDGLDARLSWPGAGTVPAARLIGDVVLPLADEGLAAWRVDRADRERYLGIIGERCRTGMTGAAWQVKTFDRLREGGLHRGAALVALTRHYLTHMREGQPVHTWPLPSGPDG